MSSGIDQTEAYLAKLLAECEIESDDEIIPPEELEESETAGRIT